MPASVASDERAVCDKNQVSLSPGERRTLRPTFDEFDARYTLWRLLDRPEHLILSAELRDALGLTLDQPLRRRDFNVSTTAYFVEDATRGRPPGGGQGVVLLLLNLFGRCIVCGEPAQRRKGALWCSDHGDDPFEEPRLRKQLSRARQEHAPLADLIRREFNL